MAVLDRRIEEKEKEIAMYEQLIEEKSDDLQYYESVQGKDWAAFKLGFIRGK